MLNVIKEELDKDHVRVKVVCCYFAFLLVPLDPRFKPRIAMMKPASQGVGVDDVITDALILKDILMK